MRITATEIAEAAAVATVVNIIVTIVSVWYIRSQSRANRTAAQAAVDSAESAKIAARAADDSAQAAQQSLLLEQDRQHDALTPNLDWEFNRVGGTGGQPAQLRCTLRSRSSHSYEIKCWVAFEAGRTELQSIVLHSGGAEDIHVGAASPSRSGTTLVLAFDGPSCPCDGRRAEPDGHWTRTIKVEFPRLRKAIVP